MKKIVFVIGVFALCLFFTACSTIDKVPTENKILSDYKAKESGFAYANFTEAKIIRQQLNKEAKQFTADVEIKGKDAYARYTSNITVKYNYYDDRGWMLDECSYVYPSCFCENGRTKDDIMEDILQNASSYIPGCIDIEYLQHRFDGECDVVDINWKTEKGYLISTYTGQLKFTYINGIWQKSDLIKTKSSYYLNIDDTKWEPDVVQYPNNMHPDNPVLWIDSISKDSTEIVFEDANGGKYTARICNGWSYPGKWDPNTFENGHMVQYLFDSGTQFYGCSIGRYTSDSGTKGIYIHMQHTDYGNTFTDPFYYMKKQ